MTFSNRLNMRILYDHQAFTMQHFGGVSKCFCELISHRPEGYNVEIAIKQSNNVHLIDSGLCPTLEAVSMDYLIWKQRLPFRGSDKVFRMLSRLSILSTSESVNRKYAIERIISGDFDLFHPTFFHSYFIPYLKGKPFVVTVHDMSPELFPQFFSKNDGQIQFKKRYLSMASGIVAVSENTKKDIVEILHIPEQSITVIPHGGPEIQTITARPLLQKPYFLYIGTRVAYKNFVQTLKDFAEVSDKVGNTLLVCTGDNFSGIELELIEKLGLCDRVIQINASEEELKNLFSHAVAFIYPSLYEGFGMPILEAYAYGCPVILNNKSCFPVIADEAALFFESDGEHSNLSEKLMKMIRMSPSDRQMLIDKGYERLKYFSWKRSSAQLFNLYDKIVDEGIRYYR